MLRKSRRKKIPLRAKTRGDWTLPGYNYLGPGNALDDYPPTNEDDRLALKHDQAYSQYIEQGYDPYWNFNDADQEFLDYVGATFPGKLAWAVFQVKKGLSHAHVLGTIRGYVISNFAAY